MSHTHEKDSLDTIHGKNARKLEYTAPRLIQYGTVQDLTKAGTKNSTEQTCSSNAVRKTCSERRVKENIVCIGQHPLGMGLYLFDYLPEYLESFGYGRQFGVMIDEVEAVMPEAISIHADGYKRVDYGMLGISRIVH